MYAKLWTILLIAWISTASLYAYTYKTPEERIIESIRIQNKAIEEANDAKVESYRTILDKCYKTATGSSREILEKLDACKNIQKPELQMIISYSGSERVSEGNEAIKYSQWEADCISKFKNEDEQFTCWMSGADYIKYKPAYKLKWDPVENNFRKFKNNVLKTTESGSVIPVPLWNSIKWKSNPSERELLDWLQVKICNKQINSPLCKDKELLARLYKITEDRIPGKNFFPILVGITNAESSLGLNFANDNVGGKCYGRNNWWGTKYQILDDNTRVYARNLNGFEYKNSKDQFGCNLYPFKSIDEYFITKVNGMRFWYKWCIDSKTPIDCISYKYVGDPNVAEESWKKNVAYFLM